MPAGSQNLVFLVLMVAIFYLVLVRPQQRRVRKHREVVASLEPGDEVVTIGGLYGYVRAIDDPVVYLEVAPGVVLRYARSAVRDKVPAPELAPTELDGTEGKDSTA